MPTLLPEARATMLLGQLLGCSRWVVGKDQRPRGGALMCRGVGKPPPHGNCLVSQFRSVWVPDLCGWLAVAVWTGRGAAVAKGLVVLVEGAPLTVAMGCLLYGSVARFELRGALGDWWRQEAPGHRTN